MFEVVTRAFSFVIHTKILRNLLQIFVFTDNDQVWFLLFKRFISFFFLVNYSTEWTRKVTDNIKFTATISSFISCRDSSFTLASSSSSYLCLIHVKKCKYAVEINFIYACLTSQSTFFISLIHKHDLSRRLARKGVEDKAMWSSNKVINKSSA